MTCERKSVIGHHYQIIDTHFVRIFCFELTIIFLSFQMAITWDNNLEQPVCSSTQYVDMFCVLSYTSKSNFCVCSLARSASAVFRLLANCCPSMCIIRHPASIETSYVCQFAWTVFMYNFTCTLHDDGLLLQDELVNFSTLVMLQIVSVYVVQICIPRTGSTASITKSHTNDNFTGCSLSSVDFTVILCWRFYLFAVFHSMYIHTST